MTDKELIEQCRKALSKAEAQCDDISEALPLMRGRLDAILPIIIPIIRKAVELKVYARGFEQGKFEGRMAVAEEIKKGAENRPRIVCLCGSTRFVDTFNEWRKRLTLEGKIVLSIELVTTQSRQEDPQHNDLEVKKALDELHLRKIDLADEVMILNVGGYIGESTRKEFNYAIEHNKEIIYLEPIGKPSGRDIRKDENNSEIIQ